MWVMIGMNLIARVVSALVVVAVLAACGGGGGEGGGGGDVATGSLDFTSLMTADLSGSQRARPNATMGALEAQ